jgi:hypothetical protein
MDAPYASSPLRAPAGDQQEDGRFGEEDEDLRHTTTSARRA